MKTLGSETAVRYSEFAISSALKLQEEFYLQNCQKNFSENMLVSNEVFCENNIRTKSFALIFDI